MRPPRHSCASIQVGRCASRRVQRGPHHPTKFVDCASCSRAHKRLFRVCPMVQVHKSEPVIEAAAMLEVRACAWYTHRSLAPSVQHLCRLRARRCAGFSELRCASRCAWAVQAGTRTRCTSAALFGRGSHRWARTAPTADRTLSLQHARARRPTLHDASACVFRQPYTNRVHAILAAAASAVRTADGRNFRCCLRRPRHYLPRHHRARHHHRPRHHRPLRARSLHTCRGRASCAGRGGWLAEMGAWRSHMNYHFNEVKNVRSRRDTSNLSPVSPHPVRG